MDRFSQKYPVEYNDPIVTHDSHDDYESTAVIGHAIMSGEVVVEIDLTEVLRVMGPKAMRSKGGRCRDGCVLVKRASGPTEISRKMRK